MSYLGNLVYDTLMNNDNLMKNRDPNRRSITLLEAFSVGKTCLYLNVTAE